jgi:hypothetical protein
MSNGIRQFHRWMAITFTLAVLTNIVVNFVVATDPQIVLWIGLATLAPLGLLMLTGLYMFVLPYVSGGQRTGAAE